MKKILLLLLINISSFSFADQLSIACAGNFYKPLKVIAAQYEKETGNTVSLSVGSTGKLYAQIINGAPFDIFIAADQTRPTALADDHQAVKESQFTYAKGKLVLWSNNPKLIDTNGSRLVSDELDTLAIANPKTAPYGEQAINVLKNLGVYQKLEKKLIQGQDIGQTFQHVSSGNVQQGMIALSQIMENGKINSGSYWIISDHLYEPINQDAILLNRGKDNLAAIQFMKYLKEANTVAIIRSFGYEVTP